MTGSNPTRDPAGPSGRDWLTQANAPPPGTGPLGQLNALAGVLGLPRWRRVVQAVAAYVDGPGRTDEQRRAVRAVLKANTAAG